MDKQLPVIDLALGAELLGSNQDTARKMIRELATMLPENLQDLNAAFRNGNIGKLTDVTHFIHGGSCYCGTPRLKAAAMELEKIAKTSSSIQNLEAAYHTLCREIEAVILESNHIQN